MNITLTKRGDEYIAALTEEPGIWQVGSTEVEAIGRLMVALAAMGKIQLLRENYAPVQHRP